ncbi:MAG: hypothetical protein ACKV2Q_33535 [Planctomycetaceae bacterium]
MEAATDREAQRARPAPTTNELQDLAKRLRKLAKGIFQNGVKTDSHTKSEVGRMLDPLQIQGWHSRAVVWQDVEQQRLFRAVACLLSEIFRKCADSPVERLQSVATDVDALAATLEPQRDGPPKHKLSVDPTACKANLDGHEMPLKPNQAKALDLLIRNEKPYMSLADNGLRSRDIDKLPPALKELVETQPGAGTRIVRDKVDLA